MPFGGYPDFDACVKDNQDKSSPEGWCSWLHHKITGEWPGEMTYGLPGPVKERFWLAFDNLMEKEKDEAKALKVAAQSVEEFGWIKQKHGWSRKVEHKLETRAVFGVPIFASGVHNGDTYSIRDLKGMVTAFHELKGRLDPPVKIGHTSDDFNKTLAGKMGVDPDLLTGENGNGAMALGWVGDLRLSGNVLYADLEDVPLPIAELIESKSYNKVSAEIIFNWEDLGKQYPKVLSGLALLGGELPAVREVGLETAAVYMNKGRPDKEIEFAFGKEGNELENIPPELQAYADAHFAGNIDSLVKWAGDVGFDGCVSSLSGKEGVSDPERLCGWLKAKARERGELASEHQSHKGEEVEIMNKEILKLLGLGEDATEVEAMAVLKRKLQEPPAPVPDPAAPSGMAAIAAALGLPEDTTLEAVLQAIEALKSEAPPALVAALKKLQESPGIAAAVLTALGLPETATLDEVLKAIEALRAKTPTEITVALKKLQDQPAGLAAVATALGLTEDATLEEVLAAIEALKTKGSAPAAEMKQYANRISTLEQSNKKLLHDNRVAYYKEITRDLTAISGTPEELANELVDLEEKAGLPTAAAVLRRYKEQNSQLVGAGVLHAKGKPGGEGEEEHEFTKKVKAYMDEHQCDEPTAQAAIRKENPKLFKEYMKQRPVEKKSGEE